jgi:ASC-1-like (ASCH) protein
MPTRTFIANIEEIINTVGDIYFVKFINKEGIIVHMDLKKNMIDLKKYNRFEFIFEEVPVDMTIDNLTIYECDLCLHGIIYEIKDNSSYISYGGLLLHINRQIGQKGTKYFTKINRVYIQNDDL